MRTERKHTLLGVALAGALCATSAQAGGPLVVSDAGNPLAWDVTNPVPVYTDLGDLCDDNPDDFFIWGCLSNEQADAAVAFSFGQWTAVETSTFQAEVAGDFSTIGLGDVTGANAGEIVGADNGGGYHVMYDSDGTIIEDFFGAGSGVLGISSPEWAEGDVITESWAVINVAAVPEGDDGTMAAGVMTHEFGHGINLSHSQANGHITFFGAPWFWISWSPAGCPAPYDIEPILDWEPYNQWIDTVMIPNTETMYPFINPAFTGAAMSTVDRPDDITAVSNLYPAAGWPANGGTISGQILLPDGGTGLTGVNVVARNIADPLGDVITVMSGDQTQGQLGPDGRYTINGLTPGAEYIVYVEPILAGGFPTPPAILPSFQEYWNGTGESEHANSDDPCAWTIIPVAAGSWQRADIAFNGIDRAPRFIQIPVPAATDVDNSGQVVAGTFAGQVAWRYDIRSGTFEVIESQSSPRLARDGKTMTADLWPEVEIWEGGIFEPGLWSRHRGWQPFKLPEGERGCDGHVFYPWDLSENADTVVGLAYRNGCPRGPFDPDWNYDPGFTNQFFAGLWTRGGEVTYLETPLEVMPGLENCTWPRPQGCDVRGSRANAISGDGRLVVGHVDAGSWKGAAWIDGRFMLMGADDPKGWIGSANAVNYDGSVVVGGNAGGDGVFDWGKDAYLWSPVTGTEPLGHMTIPCEDFAVAPWDCNFVNEVEFAAEGFGVSDNGEIVVGRAGDFWNGFVGFIWMRGLGMLEFNTFLQGQGVMEAYTSALIGPLAVSGDGHTIVGWGVNDVAQISYALTLDQVWVCRKGRSQLVGFPGAMLSHLEGGAELGLCAADRPIEPGQ